MPTTRQFLVIAYDIACDRRRARLVRLLEGVGVRANYSVFECRLAARDIPRLKNAIDTLIDPHEDSVLYYPLCTTCVDRRERTGLGAQIEIQNHVVL